MLPNPLADFRGRVAAWERNEGIQEGTGREGKGKGRKREGKGEARERERRREGEVCVLGVGRQTPLHVVLKHFVVLATCS